MGHWGRSLISRALSVAGRVVSKVHEDFAVVRVARSILEELNATSAPNVLIAEDLHWADQATLDLLRFFARRLADTHTLLIVTFRDDALDPEHELRRFQRTICVGDQDPSTIGVLARWTYGRGTEGLGRRGAAAGKSGGVISR
jgi:hypothetical protein